MIGNNWDGWASSAISSMEKVTMINRIEEQFPEVLLNLDKASNEQLFTELSYRFEAFVFAGIDDEGSKVFDHLCNSKAELLGLATFAYDHFEAVAYDEDDLDDDEECGDPVPVAPRPSLEPSMN